MKRIYFSLPKDYEETSIIGKPTEDRTNEEQSAEDLYIILSNQMPEIYSILRKKFSKIRHPEGCAQEIYNELKNLPLEVGKTLQRLIWENPIADSDFKITVKPNRRVPNFNSEFPDSSCKEPENYMASMEDAD
jgi:hypothetical protein